MMRTRSLRAGVLGIALLASACGGSPAASGGGTSGGGTQGKTIAFVGYGDASPWGAAYNKTFKAELASSGVKINDLTSMDAGTQVQNFNQAVSQKPALIVAALWDTTATVVPIQKAKQAGVPVLIVDGRPDPKVEGDVMSVLSDNVKLGEYAAQNIIEGLKAQGRDSGKVIVLSGTKAMLVTQDRMQGFGKAMAAAPQYQVIEDQDTNWDPTASGKVAQQLFAKHGCDGIQAAYGMADYMALPIVQAAKQAGCKVGGKDGLVVTGGNCFKAGIAAIKSGEMYGTATEDPITIAKQTAAYITRYLGGQNPPTSELVQEDRVTKESLAKFEEQCSQA
ncbi:sugar ABC transporter substrate-binding protein [Actinoplanes sp. NPDC049265]|uniref:sugar ABC transporter substrate-binding protein n=1 Tax=Actinoplanes sp. NPDC049265 TaxID=3363902 RepID=UPI003722B6A6